MFINMYINVINGINDDWETQNMLSDIVMSDLRRLFKNIRLISFPRNDCLLKNPNQKELVNIQFCKNNKATKCLFSINC